MAKKIYTQNAINIIRERFKKLPNFVEQRIYENGFFTPPVTVFTADGYKTYVCKYIGKREYNGEKVGAYTVRKYNKCPVKYSMNEVVSW